MNLDFSPSEIAVVSVAAVWSLFWKGIALYKAGREEDKIWFVVLLLVNTLGLLEILYIFYFSKQSKDAKKSRKTSSDK